MSHEVSDRASLPIGYHITIAAVVIAIKIVAIMVAVIFATITIVAMIGLSAQARYSVWFVAVFASNL